MRLLIARSQRSVRIRSPPAAPGSSPRKIRRTRPDLRVDLEDAPGRELPEPVGPHEDAALVAAAGQGRRPAERPRLQVQGAELRAAEDRGAGRRRRAAAPTWRSGGPRATFIRSGSIAQSRSDLHPLDQQGVADRERVAAGRRRGCLRHPVEEEEEPALRLDGLGRVAVAPVERPGLGVEPGEDARRACRRRSSPRGRSAAAGARSPSARSK